MAAYAALVSLMNTLNNIQNHPCLSTSFDKNQIESLGEKLHFLLEFVESYNNHSDGGISKKEVEDLESQIASAAHAAEDVIESHIADQILAGYSGQSPPSFLDKNILHFLPKLMFIIKKKALKVSEKRRLQIVKLHLQKIMEEMDPIKEKVIEVKKERGLNYQQLESSVAEASSRPLSTGKTTLVGLNNYLHQLLDWLTGQQSDRLIISITGMGGIGKTTLARNVYEDLRIVQHFDVCAWATISQEYSVRKILLEILSCLRVSTSGTETEDQLGEKLHKFLLGRRYLIILDDMWSVEAWDKIKFFFPDCCDRSRIVITTRISSVASNFGSFRLALNLLYGDQSWRLFCEKVFGQEDCPLELEDIGKNIVRKCRGLPLSIVAIGGLLRNSSRTEEYWEYVAKDLSSILNSAECNQCLDILALSYSHLPACLKPCFLYLGIFSEDYEIRISHLIKLWVVEGFLKPNRDQSLEEVAEGYIKDLIDRNLILIRSLGSNGKLKTCNIHDLLRDLCIKMAEKEKFFYVMRELDASRDTDRERCIVARKNFDNLVNLKSSSLARSVISQSWCGFCLNSRLLRVLYNVYSDPDSIFLQVNLRFLPSYPINPVDSKPFKLSSSISLLWNLQTLIIAQSSIKVVAPSEIWEMRQLRHLKCPLIWLPNPPLSNERDGTILQNLRTLQAIFNFRFSEEACKRMPNIKKLHVFWYHVRSHHRLCNVGRLKKLESLCYRFRQVPNRDVLLPNLLFPSSLKKLSLVNCWLDWNDLTIVGSLPNLEVLNLYPNAVRGPEWCPVEGEFRRLKFLLISKCDDLICWSADSSNFPVLEELILYGMTKLDEIPSGIGEIPTLQSICVHECSCSTSVSAAKILKEQESHCNESLQVLVETGDWWDPYEKTRMSVAAMGLIRNLNFQFIYNDDRHAIYDCDRHPRLSKFLF